MIVIVRIKEQIDILINEKYNFNNSRFSQKHCIFFFKKSKSGRSNWYQK